MLAVTQGDIRAARGLAEEALAFQRDSGDADGIARALSDLAVARALGGDPEQAQALLDEAQALTAARGSSRWLRALVLVNLGALGMYTGDRVRATVHLEEALELCDALGQENNAALCLSNLGYAAGAEGRMEEVRGYFRRSLARASKGGNVEGMVYSFEGLAAVTEDPRHAAMLLGYAQALSQTQGFVIQPGEAQIHEETAESLRLQLGDGFAAARSAGELLTHDQAIAIAGVHAQPGE